MTASYRITIHGQDGAMIDERRAEYSDDDDAIECIGAQLELREMRVWQGERLVVLFTRRSGPSDRPNDRLGLPPPAI